MGFAVGGNSDPIKSLVIPQLGAGTSYGVLTVSGQYSDVSGLHAVQREFVSGTLRKFLSVAASSDTWSVWIEVGGGIPGQVAAFAMMTPPPGWLQCNGAAVSRVSFAHLFSAIGTAYGSGDGT
ncbi:phage tail protein, partial [Cutibacterium acnes]